jgi:hypothetical protein
MKSGNLNFLEPSGPIQACNGTALPLPLPTKRKTDLKNVGLRSRKCLEIRPHSSPRLFKVFNCK